MPLTVAAQSLHTAANASTSQTLAARRVYGAQTNINQISKPQLQRTIPLDNIADGVNYNKVAATEVVTGGLVKHINDGTNIRTAAAAAGAFDGSSNLLLKNINNATGSTSNPNNVGVTYVVMPEMTVTLTTRGNKVFVVFTCPLMSPQAGVNVDAFVAIFRDGSQITQDYEVRILDSNSSPIFHGIHFAAVSFIDQTGAGSHTYDVRSKNQIQALGTACVPCGAPYVTVKLLGAGGAVVKETGARVHEDSASDRCPASG